MDSYDSIETIDLYHSSHLLYGEHEMIMRYRPGGYHPVELGDTFKGGRYKICHKLGWGGFSTVWLAKDRENNQWVSLKILRANSSRESQELRNLQLLQQRSQGNPSSKYIVQLLDSFIHEGPNGLHQCLVFELLGPTVGKILEDYHYSNLPFKPETILRMSKQLLEAIKFIHDAGMGHGDISPNNVAFTCSSHLSTITEKDLFKVLGAPKPEKLVRLDGKPLEKSLPKHLVPTAEWDHWVDEDIRIIDLGESFLQGAEPETLAQPGPLHVPEIIFAEPFDHRVDLWRAGCVIYSFIFGTIPFEGVGDDHLVSQMISLLGKLENKWQPQWDDMRLNSKFKFSRLNQNGEGSNLERLMLKRGVYDQKLLPLISVIEGLMKYLPSSRMAASQALHLLG